VCVIGLNYQTKNSGSQNKEHFLLEVCSQMLLNLRDINILDYRMTENK